MTTMKIHTIAHVPDSLANAWLQHLRDFDTAHPDCHFEVMSEAPNKPLAQIVEMLRVDPELTLTQVFARRRP